MKTAMVGNIQVQTAGRQKSDFDFAHTVNTTARFGEIQPVQCVKMSAHTSYKCNSSTVIRALPLVAPVTSGVVKSKIFHKFVGMSDLLNIWPSYLTGQSVGTYNGVKQFLSPPQLQLKDLSIFCLLGCKFTVYVLDTVNYTSPSASTAGWIRVSLSSDITPIFTALYSAGRVSYSTTNSVITSGHPGFASRFPDYVSANNYCVNARLFGNFSDFFIPCWNTTFVDSAFGKTALAPEKCAGVDIRNCDFVFTRTLATTQTGLGIKDGVLYYAVAVNMSDLGQRFYKAIVGLGYKPDFSSVKYVDVTRIFAYYKAYYDSFGLSLWTNYESTDAYYLLKQYENTYPLGLNPSDASVNNFNDAFFRFMTEVGDLFYTDSLDYVSAHRRQDVTSPSAANAGFVQDITVAQANEGNTYGAFDVSSNAGSQLEPSSVNRRDHSIYINRTTHTQVDADLLKILYRSVNIQSVAGKRLAELLRAGGYGSYVDECKSSFIGMDEVELDITDINATADSTNNVSGRSSTLGETVGKGLAISSPKKQSFHDYDTDEPGYWITLMCFVPESSYVQGVDQTIYDVDKFDEFQPDFDSVGYEIQDKSVVCSGGDWFNGDATSSDCDSSFGNVPRYMRYKVATSIINGGFLRRSERDYFLNYCLDKFIHFNDAVESAEPIDTESSDGRIEFILSRYLDVANLPLSGNVWRFINRYPWLCSFDRIFAYIGDVLKLGGLSPFGVDLEMSRWRYSSFGEDGFMFFNRFLATKSGQMLPLVKSWSTTDDPDDNKGVSMRQA